MAPPRRGFSFRSPLALKTNAERALGYNLHLHIIEPIHAHMNTRQLKFTTADVVAVTETRPGTLDAWLARGQLLVEPGPGTGRSRTYDFATVVYIAIVARLVGIGFTVSSASDAAVNTLDAAKRSSDDFVFLVLGPPSEATPGVEPSQAPTVSIINVKDVSELAQFFDMFPDGVPDAFAVIDLAAISAKVEARLTDRLNAREGAAE